MRLVLHKVASFLNFPPPIITSSIITGWYSTPLEVKINLLLSTVATKNYEQILFRVAPRLQNPKN